MDPASVVIGVVSGAAGLAALALSTTTYLLGLRDSYTHIELTVLDLVSTCQTFEISWTRIHDWASEHQQFGVESKSVFEQLLSYHETSKIVLGALHTELKQLEPNGKTTWRLTPRNKARAVLHEKSLKDHSERLSRQINSLNLLLSTAQLSSPRVQDVVLDLLQPIFRKDEESAWTVVKSRASTKRPAASSMFSKSNRTSMIVLDNTPIEHKHFDFENELILGPVYKRALFSHLCTLPAITEPSGTGPGGTSSSSVVTSNGQGSSTTESAGSSTPTEATSSLDDVDWSPENIVRILRESGGFSVSVLADLRELKLADNPSGLQKRSLPLGSILKQHQMVPEAQKFLNAKLIFGAATDDANVVAQALEEGAEINTVSDSGLTALQIGLSESLNSEVAALLLLYKETKVHLRNENGETLLHQAVRAGNAPLVRRLVTRADDLRVVDGSGATPLHVAARGGHHRLTVLKEMNRMFAGQEICADKCLDRQGKTPLHEAARGGHVQHTEQLMRLGCDPTVMPSPGKRVTGPQVLGSPLWLAVEAGHVEVVRKIFDECSLSADRTGLVDLANWRHHPQRALLDCVRDSSLPQRYDMAELLISHGLEWKTTFKQCDKLLEFANTGKTPLLLLRLISVGCMPTLRSLDITKSMGSLLTVNNPELVAMALFSLSSINAAHIADTSRPQIYARMGNGEEGLFTEVLTLRDILTQILSRKTLSPAGEHAALTHTEAAADALLPASIALHTDITTLGRLYYEIDKCMVDAAASNEAGRRYMENFVWQNKIAGL